MGNHAAVTETRRGRRRAARLAATVAAAGAAGAGMLAAAPQALAAPSCSAGTCTVSFTAPGTGAAFTVPAGVSSLSVTLYGGAGGGTSFGGQNVAGRGPARGSPPP